MTLFPAERQTLLFRISFLFFSSFLTPTRSYSPLTSRPNETDDNRQEITHFRKKTQLIFLVVFCFLLSFPGSESGDLYGNKKKSEKKKVAQQLRQQQREANSAAAEAEAAASQTEIAGNQVSGRVAFTLNLSITYCDKPGRHMRGRTFLFIDHRLTAHCTL